MIQKSNQTNVYSENEESLISLAKDANDEAFFKISSNYDRMIKKIISCFDVPESEFDDLYQEGLIGLYKAVKGSKTVTGILTDYKDGIIYIETNGSIMEFAKNETASVRLR